ncbi:hypothetical protein HC761_00745 [bacterium]|nr:hypothetical protein [bacterium]
MRTPRTIYSRLTIRCVSMKAHSRFERMRTRLPADTAKKLFDAGLLTRESVEGASTVFRYDLSDFGREVYAAGADPRLSGLKGITEPPMAAKPRPRFCFGETSLHRISAALPPTQVINQKWVSAKLVYAVRDPHPQLGSAALAPLTISCQPATPEKPGEPALCPALIMTYGIMPDGTLDPRPDDRYGPWVNE